MFEIAAVGLVESDTTHDLEKKGGRREKGGRERRKEKKTPFASERGFCVIKKQKIHMKGLETTINGDIENACQIDLWRSR